MTRRLASELRTSPGNLLRSLFSAGRRREMAAWRRLVLAARGDEAVAERLVLFELDRQPWLFRHEAIDAACARLEHDRER